MSQFVESYRFWDVVTLWAQKQLQHEHIVARVLARGVMRGGLRMQSVDPRWTDPGTFELRGPLVPVPHLLFEEFVTKQDFEAWLKQLQMPLPSFWFAPEAG
ncbi:MAG: hypothetical protein HY854_24270 [Burkholderiales bacterium]|nr:hypothetical protein [Burkholderiales bacterium]